MILHRNHRTTAVGIACMAAVLVAGCSKKEPAREATAPKEASQAPAAPVEAQQPDVKDKAELEGMKLPSPFGRRTGDLDVMLKGRNIRAIVMINPTSFFYSNGHPMGVMYEALRELETFVNTKYKTGALKVKVSFIPVRPDQVEAALLQGVGDMIAFPVVITPERQQLIAFTVPLQKDVKHVVVSGPNFGKVATVEDLGGKEVYANPLAAAYGELEKVNQRLRQEGKPAILVKASDKELMEDDLVEMVSAGLIPATVTSDTKAKLWVQVLPNLTVQEAVIAEGGQTAWAVRKDNPQLKQLLDEFIPPRAVGTSFGNTLLRRYLQNTKWVKNSTAPAEMKKFEALSAQFKEYAGQYDFDYLMIMAQGYQESLLDQSRRNPSGAVGIMQVIPKYAAASPINIPSVMTTQNNILAGVKMLRDIEDRYFNDPQLDQVNKTLMVFASYNAGPNRIARLRKQAAAEGLDPNKWFGNVELMVAKDIGQETINYVSNIYKYYVAYKLAAADAEREKTAAAAR